MNKKEILDILDNAKDESGAVPMRLVRQAFDKLVQPEERTEKHTKAHACDLVERQAVLDLARDLTFKNIEGLKHYRYRCIDPDHVRELKSVQLTEAIPVAWIEEEIAILKAKGNELAPMLMSAILSSELDNWKERLKNDNS